MDAQKTRDRMASLPFAPIDPTMSAEFRTAHAAEYVAFYLGEIEKHLAKIAESLEESRDGNSSVAASLKEIQTSLAKKMNPDTHSGAPSE